MWRWQSRDTGTRVARNWVVRKLRPGSYPHLDVYKRQAQAFADGAKRTKALRDCAWDTQRAVSESHDARANAASEAARSAFAAAGAAFLPPIVKATQVKRIRGWAAHATRAMEISGGDDHEIGKAQLETLLLGDLIRVREVLCRYPEAPPGGGRVGELIRQLDALRRAK